MNKAKILRLIKNNTWWSEEGPAVPQFSSWATSAYLGHPKFFHPRQCRHTIFIFKNDFVYEESVEKEKGEVFNYVLARYARNKKYFQQPLKYWRQVVRKIIYEGKKFAQAPKQLSNHALYQSYQRFYTGMQEHWRITIATESADIYTTYRLKSLVRESLPSLKERDIDRFIYFYTVPNRLSFIERERFQLLSVAKKLVDKKLIKQSRYQAVKKSDPQAGRLIENLAKNFYWIHNNYKRGIILKPDYFYKNILAVLKNRSKLNKEYQSLKNKISKIKNERIKWQQRLLIPVRLKMVFNLLQFIGGWIDQRKEVALRASHYSELYMREFARRFRIDGRLVRYYMNDELRELCYRGKPVPVAILKRRRRGLVRIVWREGRYRFRERDFVGNISNEFYKALFPEKAYHELTGQVASAPLEKIRGIVKIVLDTDKERFPAGKILVTTMTRAEFIPLMRRAKAVITDEGGLTSHAAVVSREFNIPCIIGTRVATKVLKSGDRVEIDTNRGIVKKI
ncbi:MAG: PEP-utilizing enzyme [Patescibacteria group bacterium]